MAKHAVSGVSGNTLNDTQLEVLRIGISDLAPASPERRVTPMLRRFAAAGLAPSKAGSTGQGNHYGAILTKAFPVKIGSAEMTFLFVFSQSEPNLLDMR
ncbi:hypothetical protein M2315_004383 [Agrobacterium fabrum]|nr:hypothetical protein [Agrobacterium fabrum]